MKNGLLFRCSHFPLNHDDGRIRVSFETAIQSYKNSFLTMGKMSQYKAPKGLFDCYSSTPRPPQKNNHIFTSEHLKIRCFPSSVPKKNNPPVWAGTTTSGRRRYTPRYSSSSELVFARLPALEAAPNEEEKSDKAGPLEISGPFFS